MVVPKGFEELVMLAIKDRSKKPKSREEIWNKFLRIVFMGGKRSEPETNFLINMLKTQKVLDMDFLKKTDGEDWREAVNNILDERMKRIKDEDTLEMLKEFQKELFRISASIKGGARFFDKNNIGPERLDEMLGTKEQTWEFIDNLAKDEDVSNIKYTKVIIWLHSMGYAFDFCPPTWQVKKFINEDIGPYYQFYEDDKYFMKKGEEFAEEIKKKTKKATTRDVATAIFFYIAFKSMMPPRSAAKKDFVPLKLIKFMKAKKLTLNKLSEKLADSEEREALADALYKFLTK